MTTVHPLLTAAAPGAPESPHAYLAGGFYQIGYVVPDLEQFIDRLRRDFGLPRFFVLPDAQVDGQTHRGALAAGRQTLAFGYAGNVQIEVIQPLSGENTYTEFLAERHTGGLHHVGSIVDDYDRAIADLERIGYPVVQTGRVGETRFAYLDAVSVLGAYLEVFRLAPEFIELFDRIRRQDF